MLERRGAEVDVHDRSLQQDTRSEPEAESQRRTSSQKTLSARCRSLAWHTRGTTPVTYWIDSAQRRGADTRSECCASQAAGSQQSAHLQRRRTAQPTSLHQITPHTVSTRTPGERTTGRGSRPPTARSRVNARRGLTVEREADGAGLEVDSGTNHIARRKLLAVLLSRGQGGGAGAEYSERLSEGCLHQNWTQTLFFLGPEQKPGILPSTHQLCLSSPAMPLCTMHCSSELRSCVWVRFKEAHSHHLFPALMTNSRSTQPMRSCMSLVTVVSKYHRPFISTQP